MSNNCRKKCEFCQKVAEKNANYIKELQKIANLAMVKQKKQEFYQMMMEKHKFPQRIVENCQFYKGIIKKPCKIWVVIIEGTDILLKDLRKIVNFAKESQNKGKFHPKISREDLGEKGEEDGGKLH